MAGKTSSALPSTDPHFAAEDEADSSDDHVIPFPTCCFCLRGRGHALPGVEEGGEDGATPGRVESPFLGFPLLCWQNEWILGSKERMKVICRLILLWILQVRGIGLLEAVVAIIIIAATIASTASGFGQGCSRARRRTARGLAAWECRRRLLFFFNLQERRKMSVTVAGRRAFLKVRLW